MADIGMIISSVISGLFFILFFLLVYQTIRKNRTAYVLTFSLLLGGIGGIISVLQYVITAPNNLLLYLSLQVWSFVYFMIYIFFEELYTNRPQRYRLVIVTIILFASIMFNLLHMFMPTSGELGLTGATATNYLLFYHIVEWSWDISYNLLGLIIFVFGAYVHFKAYKFSKDKIILLQTLSMCVLAAGFIVGFVGGDIIDNTLFFDIGDGVKILGMIIFTLIYAIFPDFIYRLPVNVYFILIFTKIGLNIHIGRVHDSFIGSKDSEEQERQIISENLLSSLITAISGLLNESLGSKKDLEGIIAADRSLILDNGESATCAILCDKSTYFLEKSLRNLRKAIETRYEGKLKNPVILKEDFLDADKLIRKSFPFLKIV
ncbi:MAG TPA: hypothetical protein VMX55_08430 [candidate division Zixibacteria bacterium]|nr:hypothetical protein [candidate division Zixibacteria bacterium]